MRRLALPLLLAAACSSAPAAPNAPEAQTPAAAANASTAAAAAPPSPADAPDRSDADKALDAGRHPKELLEFAGIKPGMKVAEIAAGGGYTTELLARAVGSSGVVYAENNKFVIGKFAAKPWAERLAKPVMKNVVRVDRELGDPLPPEAHDLDAVVIVLFYHDAYWMGSGADVAKMNAAIYKALKPGGVYVIVDHSGRAASGTAEVKTLHRIEESIVRADVQSVGFKLAGEAQFLRNPKDTRDWNDSPTAAGDKRGTSDRFVLKFVK